MFLVMDNATNNVLAEFASFIEADQWRSQVVAPTRRWLRTSRS